MFVVIFVVTAVSNGANLTDGLDGLCAGTSAIIGVALAIVAYLGGNVIYSGYLNIMYIPGSEELVVFAGAFIGALVGFLWYNAFPAQVFMGDTGSLHHRRHTRRLRHPHTQGAADTAALPHILHRRPFGDDAGGVFQIHQGKDRETESASSR